ncbi:membrane protein [Vallitalea longa]|uniref:Membrane protein n=1 Tax=Vallitalea longa TaxID=2936439 RepID=A0A9W6DG33_9FIRM|nr:YitT family protein [Vallitalea longa]GKX31200.1 membrane protein [Vallitalea longa]
MKKKLILKDIFNNIIGLFLFATGIYVFTSKNQIAPGGVSGIATLINYLTDVPIGLTSLLINVPLIVLAFIFLGKKFVLRTLTSVMILSFMLDIGVVWLPVYRENALLASIFGGVCLGIGLSIVFISESSTGGGDILGKLIQKKHPYLSIGKILLAIDFVVISLSAFVYKNIESAMYGLITMFITSKIVDALIEACDKCKLLFIMSDKSDEIANGITEQLKRGATLIDGKGAYSGENKAVLLVAVKKREVYKAKELIRYIDPSVFIVAAEAGEIVGEGFKSTMI